MPELPEVDSYRTGLDKITKGWKLKGGKSIWAKACIDDFKRIKNQKYQTILIFSGLIIFITLWYFLFFQSFQLKMKLKNQMTLIM